MCLNPDLFKTSSPERFGFSASKQEVGGEKRGCGLPILGTRPIWAAPRQSYEKQPTFSMPKIKSCCKRRASLPKLGEFFLRQREPSDRRKTKDSRLFKRSLMSTRRKVQLVKVAREELCASPMKQALRMPSNTSSHK